MYTLSYLGLSPAIRCDPAVTRLVQPDRLQQPHWAADRCPLPESPRFAQNRRTQSRTPKRSNDLQMDRIRPLRHGRVL